MGGDTLIGGDSGDVLQAVGQIGGPGSLLIAGAGHNTLIGGLAADTLDGTHGSNLILAGTGGGSIVAGSGADTLSFANAGAGVVVQLEAVSGGASVAGGVFTLSGALQGLIGSAFSDTLSGAAGTQLLDGGSGGNDQFDLRGGGTTAAPVTVIGGRSGTGNTLTFAADTVGGVIANLGTGLVEAGVYGSARVSGIQRLIGSAAGGDQLTGGAGVTYLSAGTGALADTLDGGGGGTVLAPEQVVGAANGSTVLTFASYAAVGAGLRIDLSFGTAGSPVSGSSENGVLTLSNIHHVIGSSAGNDTIIGDSADDTLEAGGGSALILAGTGHNLLIGGPGSNIINATAGSNLIDSGGGRFLLLITDGNQAHDTLTFARATDGVTVNLQTGTARGYGILQIQGGVGGLLGSAYGDVLTGSATTLLIDGGGGVVTIDPGGGGKAIAGSEEVIRMGAGTASVLTYATAAQGVSVDLVSGVAAGAGFQQLQNATRVVGSAYADTLIGNVTTRLLDGGAGGNDSFRPGGGGQPGAVESIIGGTGGLNTLDLSQDTVHAFAGSLLTPGTYTPAGTLDGGGAEGYGLLAVSNIQQIIGSAIGGDSLTGAPGVRLLQAGSATASDTFDPGGGGTLAAPESIIGGASAIGSLTYASDTVSGITANLATGLVTGYGVQQLTNIQRLFGSAHGGDLLVGAATTQVLAAGSSSLGDTFDGGGGGSSLRAETIIGALNGINTLTFASDPAGGVTVDFGASPSVGANTGTATGYGVYALTSIQVVIGTATGGDLLRGGPGVQVLMAGSAMARDTFDGGGGGTIIGGSGGGSVLTFARDTQTGGGVLVDLSATQPYASATGYGELSLSNIHNIIGSAAGADTLIGDGGDDRLQAGGGAASLRAGTGHNTLIGGGGADTLDASVGSNLIDSGGGRVTVIGSASSLTGSDTLTFINASGGVTVDLSPLNASDTTSPTSGQPGTATGYGSISITGAVAEIIGSRFDDKITGSRSTRMILAGSDTSHDTFDGGGGGTVLGYETLAGARAGSTTLTYASMPVSPGGAGVTVNGGGGQAIGLGTGTALGYGAQAFSYVQTIIGSGNSDSLTGGAGVRLLDGGSGGNDTFDSGGAGDSLGSAMVVQGVAGADNTLTFAHDTVGGITANLGTGLADAGGSGGYGYVSFSNIDRLIGSAAGGDWLTGTTTTLLLGNIAALKGDTFDAGGGGTLAAPESILGASLGINTLTYAADTVGSLYADLSAGIVTTTGYGVQALQNIQILVGSAYGGDHLIGTRGTRSLTSGSALRGDTFDGGLGGTALSPETITGSVTGINLLTFASDTLHGATVDLSQGTANVTAGLGVYRLSHIEAVEGSGLSDSLRGSRSTVSLTGGTGGDDSFDGGGGGTALAPETITGSTTGTNTLSFASDTVAGLAFSLQSTSVTALPGYGWLQVSNIQALIGNGFADTLTGNTATVSIDGGTGRFDLIDSGGGGTRLRPETIIGGSGGDATLTFAADTVHGLYADLSMAVGTIDGGDTLGYGYVLAQNISVLIGSAVGGDTLIGGAARRLVAGSATAVDTFDGGGGAATVTLTGSAAGGTVTFARDTISGVAGGVTVNLQASVVSGAYGNEVLSNIHHVIGSALGNDVITGDSANDTLEAGGGTVTLIAGTGNNLLVAGAGTDSVNALQGTNTILAGTGRLLLLLGTGADTLSFASAAAPASGTAGVTADLGQGRVFGLRTATLTGGGLQGIVGTAFDDSLIGAASTRFMDGGSGGNDTFVAGGGDMTVTASGTGTALLSFAQDTATGAGVTVNLASGTATGFGKLVLRNIHQVIGSANGADSLTGDSASDVLTAGSGATTLVAGAGGGTLNGGAGPDLIDASQGSSLINVVGAFATVIGGAGADTLSFAGEAAGVTADARITVAGTPIRLTGSFSEIDGSAFADSLRGSSATNILSGGGGADTLDGGGGGSTAAPETVTAVAGSGATASFQGDTNALGVLVDLTRATAQATGAGYGVETLVNIHNIIGSASGADTIIGDGSGDVLTAGAGNVSIVAGAGVNTLNGGTGRDTIDASHGTNLINITGPAASILGGSGADTLSFAGATFAARVDLIANAAGGRVTVNGAIQALIGSAQGDSLRGSAATLLLSGGSGGADTLDGGGAGDGVTGRATVIGGGALSTLTFAADRTHAVSADLGLGVADAGGATGYGFYSLRNIQKLIGSAVGGDLLIGAATTRYLGAAPGSLAADTFDGGGGGVTGAAETIDAGSTTGSLLTFANETASGGGELIDLRSGTASGSFGLETLLGIHRVTASAHGADTIYAEVNVADTLTAGGGSDTVFAGTGDLILAGGGTGLLVNLPTGRPNTLSFANDTTTGAGITVGLTAGGETISGFGGTVTVVGGLTALIGSAGSDRLIGSAVSTSLDGGTGGNDTFDGGGAGTALAPESLTGSATGSNTVTFAADTVGGVTVNLATHNVSGTYGYETLTNIHNVIGSLNGADSITGDGAGDALTVTGRGSTVIGGAGNDTITVGSAFVAGLGSTGQVDGGGGSNTLVLDWRGGANAAAQSFDLLGVYAAIRNITTLDLSQNGTRATTYTISAAEVRSMTGGADLTLKLGANDHLSFSLGANESVQAGPNNTTYIVDSHNVAIATLHVS